MSLDTNNSIYNDLVKMEGQIWYTICMQIECRMRCRLHMRACALYCLHSFAAMNLVHEFYSIHKSILIFWHVQHSAFFWYIDVVLHLRRGKQHITRFLQVILGLQLSKQITFSEWQFHSLPGACRGTVSCWGALWRGAKSYKKGTTRKLLEPAEFDSSSQIPNYLKQ